MIRTAHRCGVTQFRITTIKALAKSNEIVDIVIGTACRLITSNRLSGSHGSGETSYRNGEAKNDSRVGSRRDFLVLSAAALLEALSTNSS